MARTGSWGDASLGRLRTNLWLGWCRPSSGLSPPPVLLLLLVLALALTPSVSSKGVQQQQKLGLPATAVVKAAPAGKLRTRVYPKIFLPIGRAMKVLILSDMHYGEWNGRWGRIQDRLSTAASQTFLLYEQPDFVVVLGDLLSGEALLRWMRPVLYVKGALNPILNKRLPFACAYGDHDISYALSRRSIFDFETRLPGSFTQSQNLSFTEESTKPVPLPGITNFVLPLHAYGPNNPIVAQFVFLDSNGISGLDHRGWYNAGGVDYVTAPQVAFLNETLEASWVPTYVFMHIPPPQYQLIQENWARYQCVGFQAEPVLKVQGADEGLWDQIMSNDQIVAVFAAHNHGTGWCCNVTRAEGMRPLAACFGRRSGYGGYGNWPRAARVFTVDPINGYHVNTYVRGEDGIVQDGFSL